MADKSAVFYTVDIIKNVTSKLSVLPKLKIYYRYFYTMYELK